MKSAITISLVPESRGGPFVFSGNLAAGCTRARELGFDAVEIFPPSVDAINPAELSQLLRDNGLKLAAVGTGAGWVKHKLRLTDPDAVIRKRAQDFAAGLIDFAAEFGAPAIIGSMQGRCEGTPRTTVLQWLGEGLEELGSRAQSRGQNLLFEALNRYETDVITSQNDAAAFLQTLRAQNIKLLCDLFHMNIEEVSLAQTFRSVAPLVGHVHFADSNRRAIGLGHLDVPPIIAALREIGYSGYLSAEVLPLPDEDAAARQSLESFKRYAT